MFTWVFNNTHGSELIAMLVHNMNNVIISSRLTTAMATDAAPFSPIPKVYGTCPTCQYELQQTVVCASALGSGTTCALLHPRQETCSISCSCTASGLGGS